MSETEPIEQLAGLVGIETRYIDAWGNPRQVPVATVRAILASLGLPVDDAAEIARAADALRRRSVETPLEPVCIARLGVGPIAAAVSLPAEDGAATLAWEVIEEGGSRHRGEARFDELQLAESLEIDGRQYQRRRLRIEPPPPLGYHRLSLRVAGDGGAETVTQLVVVPPRAFLPPPLADIERSWGFTVQLYALRSARNWGIGDFTDLGEMVARSVDVGAGAIGLNPLHALFLDEPERASPYSPSSRLFINALYLDVEAIDDFGECAEAQALVRSEDFQGRLRALRDAALVDHAGVAACKRPVLDLLFGSFSARHLDRAGDERGEAFRAFQTDRGPPLRRHAAFEALRERLSANDLARRYWRRWPAAYRDPTSSAVAAFVAEHRARVEFFEYLQWQADLQLGRCAVATQAAAMPIGLYHDFAVGADDGGGESWALQETLAGGVVVGAPPDLWNLNGQKWGFPPFNPVALRERGYAPFIEILRANMRHAGALRIDHVLGFMRLFWIPADAPAADGAYVRYRFDEIVGILALESVRNRCLVIGEDLGTVPEGFQAALQEAGVLSYRVLYFEQETDGAFRAPSAYPTDALVAIGTHDLPTFPAYWKGVDIDLRRRLGLYPEPDKSAADLSQRDTERTNLAAALRREGLLSGDRVPEAAPVEAAYRFLARTPARLLMVHFEDALGQTDQINVPATQDEYPNWRHKLSADLDAVFGDERVRALAAAIDAERGAPAGRVRAAVGEAPDARPPPPPAIPVATYRLQLNQGFPFDAAAGALDYLQALGVSHIYTSSYLKARPGSPHGYDITDHNALNPELGSADSFDRLCAGLAARGMGHILDFIPNHMGIGKADNLWWLDMLEWGQASPFAAFFDIDWQSRKRELRGKVLLPFLGDQYGAVLEDGDLRLRFDAATGTFSVWYHEHRFPVRPRHYAEILRRVPEDAWGGAADEGAAALARLADAFAGLRPEGLSRPRRAEVRERGQALQRDLAALAANDAMAAALDAAAASYDGRPGEPPSFVPLHRLLERQAYRLAFWRVASDEINYRRFFDINDLAGACMENGELFEAAHGLVARFLAEGKLHGLRIDHIDGLLDPEGYCLRLQALARRCLPPAARPGPESAPVLQPDRPLYIVVEKILARHEWLNESWPVAGTTGYEALNLINGLFVDAAAEPALDRGYRRFVGQLMPFDEIVHAAKTLVIDTLMSSELNVLASELDRLSEQHWRTRDFTLEGLRSALKEVVAGFPVYRTYVGPAGPSSDDRRQIDWAVAQAKRRWLGPDREILDFVRAALTIDLATPRGDGFDRADLLRFAMKFQQYTGPVMAKAFEDTCFYRYNRLLSVNEVGGDPRQLGVSVAAFHRQNQERAARWPGAMLASATHDTKRGEDVRARIDVLSDLADEWGTRARRWTVLNRAKRRDVDDRTAPSRNDEYMIYQTLVGAWPVELLADGPLDPAAIGEFAKRLHGWLLKALREAKQRTSWANADPAYEGACTEFLDRILDVSRANPFLDDFRPFQARVAYFGMLNGLAQTTLKLTLPGVPDIYQGTELWDLNLVDPDNRRPVDFALRHQLLGEVRSVETAASPTEAVRRWLGAWPDGRIKLHLILTLLGLRHRHPDLFVKGGYEPLEASGARAEHVVAFQRRGAGAVLVVAVGRLLGKTGAASLDPQLWQDTTVAAAPGGYRDVLTGRAIEAVASEHGGTLRMNEVFGDLPVGVLVGTPAS